jgi:hypothetical protein
VRGIRPDGSNAAALRLEFGGKAYQFVIGLLLQEITRQIGFVEALLDDDLVPGSEIVQARGHRSVPPVDRCLALGIGFGLLDGVRIVYDNVIAALAGCRTSDRRRNPDAGLVVLESLFRVDVRSQLRIYRPIVPGTSPTRSIAGSVPNRGGSGWRCSEANNHRDSG